MNTAKKEAIEVKSGGTALPIPVQSETSAIISMIERAARDPSVDLDKLKQLMAMRREVEADAAEKTFNIAMRAAQADMGRVRADATNSQTRSRYATYAAMDRALRPIYVKYGFSLSFDEADSPKPEHIRVLCYVSHEAGHTRTYHKDMPADGKGAKGGDVMTKTHAAGSASSYGMRYLLKGIFNVAIGDDDDDGNAAGNTGELLSPEQVEEMQGLIVERGANLQAFLKWAKVEKIEDIRATFYESCMSAIRRAGK